MRLSVQRIYTAPWYTIQETRFGFFQNLSEHDGFGHYAQLHLGLFVLGLFWKGHCWNQS
jgi:hypothetical protein